VADSLSANVLDVTIAVIQVTSPGKAPVVTRPHCMQLQVGMLTKRAAMSSVNETFTTSATCRLASSPQPAAAVMLARHACTGAPLLRLRGHWHMPVFAQ
jgi:hypothetical protein